VAARTWSSGITTIEFWVANDPVKSLIPSAPRSSAASTSVAAMAALFTSGNRAGST